MRTTLDLDDDVLQAAKEIAAAKGMTAGKVVSDLVRKALEPVARPMPIYPKRPQVVLVVGVNGSGKTTTIGKLASQFKAAGKVVVIAAGDTFRAAAVEQLQIWGTRAGVPVMTAAQGSEPASLACSEAADDGMSAWTTATAKPACANWSARSPTSFARPPVISSRTAACASR